MSFKEKSALVMAFAVLAGGAFYIWKTNLFARESTLVASPLLPVVVLLVVLMTVISVFGHAIAAVFAPKDASSQSDERDRQIKARAGSFAGYVYATAVVCALGWYLLTEDGDLLFHFVFLSLFLGQFAEYAFQILLYRRA